MKNFLLKIIFYLLKLTKGKPFTTLYSGKVQILMFHRVVEDFGKNRINNDGIEVTQDYLEYLIKFYLKQGFTPVSIDKLPEIINEVSSKRYVIFTFDDGYYDNFDKALPIFEKYNIPFSVYIPIDLITRKQFGWWYFIEDIIRDNKTISYRESGIEKISIIESIEQKASFFIQLRKIIQTYPETLDNLIERYKPNMSLYFNLFLNPEQLIKLAEHPLVTIGSHSVSHPSLAKISDQQSFEELYYSKIELERILGKKIDHFSYPFGTEHDVSERELVNAKKVGYLTALTTSYGDVYSNSNLLRLPRIWTSNANKEIDLLKNVYGINAFNMRKNKS